MQTLFERAGGLPTTRALADEFFNVMQSDKNTKRLLEMHPDNLHMSRLKLYKFLTEWFGGPKLFGNQYVNAEWLELKHRRLHFNEDEKSQWLYCMNTAMDNLKFDAVIKQEIITLFNNMITKMQSIQNQIN